jgi:hypothetical protein
MAYHPVRKEPCASCPYRQDCPSGVWSEGEYEKLERFDNNDRFSPADRFPDTAIFMCHQPSEGAEALCRGWLSVHADDIAVRIALVSGATTRDDVDAPVKTPLFGSGREASEAGKAAIRNPSPEAIRHAQKIMRLRAKQRSER